MRRVRQQAIGGARAASTQSDGDVGLEQGLWVFPCGLKPQGRCVSRAVVFARLDGWAARPSILYRASRHPPPPNRRHKEIGCRLASKSALPA